VRFVFAASKMRHAVQAGKGCASTLASVRVELLLGEHIAASLDRATTRCQLFVGVQEQGDSGAATYLAGEGHHCWFEGWAPRLELRGDLNKAAMRAMRWAWTGGGSRSREGTGQAVEDARNAEDRND
jgi:hypothetical protein